MAGKEVRQKFSGAAKVWENFASSHPFAEQDDFSSSDSLILEEFRDEYIRLPYDDSPRAQECCW